MKEAEVIIVGAGPAGVACAVQLKRTSFDVLVIEKRRVGGRAWQAGAVENLAGWTSLPGEQIAAQMNDQLAHWKIPVEFAEVTKVTGDRGTGILPVENHGRDVRATRYILHAEDGPAFESKVVVIATGVTPKVPEVAPPLDPDARRVYYNVLDIPYCENKRIGIIGSGDVAFDYALSVCDRHNVTILVRSERLSAIPLLIERAESKPGIEILRNHASNRIEPFAEKVEVEIAQTGKTLTFDYLVIAIGSEASLPLIEGIDRIPGDELRLAPSLYVIGDAAHIGFRQISIAMGDGLRVAMTITENRTRHG
ncbi:MAG: NAD(P)/FAD-dependent oxidoreductase [Planctomycetes bacterium]|nr:NAD(P)/FAD-dependent oxidoreductase [Planctomycetota bacterium]